MLIVLVVRRVGPLRLRLPQPIESYNGSIDATGPARQCLQLNPSIREDMPPEMLKDLRVFVDAFSGGAELPQGEDCMSCIGCDTGRSTQCSPIRVGLTINVQVPEGTRPGDKLPVIAVSTYCPSRS